MTGESRSVAYSTRGNGRQLAEVWHGAWDWSRVSQHKRVNESIMADTWDMQAVFRRLAKRGTDGEPDVQVEDVLLAYARWQGKTDETHGTHHTGCK